VLLSAFTNRAVDNALEALRDQGFEDWVASARPDGAGETGGILRVGSETGVRDDMQDVRLVQRGDPTERRPSCGTRR